MKFSDLENKMRVFETNSDYTVLPEIYMVARIDGRSFTKLTKDVLKYEAPYDIRFRDAIVKSISSVITDLGFSIIYGYTQSDEISLLFSLNEEMFNRKTRKLNSILAAGIASRFSLIVGLPVEFDCRICELPNANLVIDYFKWRQEDAARNALNSWCYWTYRKEGLSGTKASNLMKYMSYAQKHEFLFERGINFNDLPLWQKRGTGFYWECYIKEGYNPKTKENVFAARRRLKVDYELLIGQEYGTFLIETILFPNG